MSEEKQSEVFIKREGVIYRWGQAAYFRTWNGLKETCSIRTVKFLALPAGIALSIFTYFFSAQKDVADTRGSEVRAPGVSSGASSINLPILEEKDIPNRISRPRVASGAMGKIKVFNLRQLSDVPVGTEARATLESGATNGIVKAKLLSAMEVDGEPLLPEGATIFGKGKSSEERLYVEFTKVIFPTGESFSIRGQAFDVEDKILGLKGSLVGTRTKKMGMAIGFGVLGGMTDALQDTSGSSLYGGYQRKSMRDAALTGASKAALDQSQAYMGEMKISPNIIEVKKGTQFYLIIDEPKQKDNE
jgi:hypothetical protein